MTIISDLPWELVEEILSGVSITSLRSVGSTCNRWYTLSKDESFTKKHCGKATKEFLVTMNREYLFPNGIVKRRFSLHNIEDLSSLKELGHGMFCPLDISNVVYQCDGLFLLVAKNLSGLLVWNPYLVQIRWIEPKTYYHKFDSYAIGYDNKSNHKILRVFHDFDADVRDDFYDYDESVRLEIYEFKSNSWRVLDIIPDFHILVERGVSLKGNTYFVGHQNEDFVICFDFTTEKFGPRLYLPIDIDGHVNISCAREEQLAVFFGRYRGTGSLIYEMEIWITTKIEPNAVWWSKFFKVDIQLSHNSYFLSHRFDVQSFFVDKEKKIAVVCGTECNSVGYEKNSIMVGEDGYFEEMDLRDVFSYVPSSVQIIQ